jgi:phage-related protein
VLGTVLLSILIPAIIAWGIQSTISGAKSATAWTLTQLGAIRGAAASALAATGVVAGWILMGAQSLLGAAKVAAAWLIAMGPIALVVAAVAAVAGVVFLIIKHWDTIKEKTKAAWDWVVAQVKKVPGLIVGFFLNFTRPGLIIKHWGSIKGTFSDGAAAVVKFMRDLPGKILKAIGNLGGLLGGVGEDIMNGLLDGIDKGFEWVKDKLSGVGKIIPGWLKKVLGISSPSKVVRDQVGQWIPAGVAEGIEAGIPGVRRAVDQMAGATSLPRPAAHLGQAAEQAAYGPGGASMTPIHIEMPITTHPSQDNVQIGNAASERLAFVLGMHGVPTR